MYVMIAAMKRQLPSTMKGSWYPPSWEKQNMYVEIHNKTMIQQEFANTLNLGVNFLYSPYFYQVLDNVILVGIQ